MARIQQSIEVNVPVHAAYVRLMQFEEYPRFMQDIEAVRQLDDTHLHWAARMSDRNMEWDSEITERLPDRCIAWRNLGGPQNNGRVELQAMGRDKASVTLTMECDPGQMLAAADGNAERAMTQRVAEDLARFKKLIEKPGMQGAARDAHPATAEQPGAQELRSTQSEASLSRAADEEDAQGRFQVAGEQNFDEQSDQARRVGQLPQEEAAGSPTDTMAQAMRGDDAGARSREKLDQALDRTVPPSEESGGQPPGRRGA